MNWQDIEGDRERYAAYLCSREWSVLKAAVHERSGGVCERCRRNPVDAVHHLTYARKYSELLEDLQGICNPCHEFTHAKSDHDPAASLPGARIVKEGDGFVIEAGGARYDFGTSVGMSLLHGLIDLQEINAHIALMADCVREMKQNGWEATDGQ